MNIDLIRDFVQHTQGIGLFDTLRIRGTQKETKIDAVNQAKAVTMEGVTVVPEPEFDGIFGMPNLNKLSAILTIPEYRENASISVKSEAKDGNTKLTGIKFINADGDFTNDYRFMSESLITKMWGDRYFPGAKWNVEFTPQVASIQRFKSQVQVYKEEPLFVASVTNGDLYFNFGTPSAHCGNFVFQKAVKGSLKGDNIWAVEKFLPILDLPGDKTIRISDLGVTNIEVNSGLCIYNYFIMPESK